MKKKRFILVGVLLILILFCCIRFYSKGHNTVYQLGKKDEYEVHEIYTKNVGDELDNYYLEITKGNLSFSFQLFDTYKERRKIVEDILYYDGEYKCMLPIIDDTAQTDISCYKNNRYYNYATIMGKDRELDKFVEEIDINIYDVNDYLDESTEVEIDSGIRLYVHNVNDKHHIAISNLQGVFLINDSIKDIEIFDKDIYSRKLSTVVGDYYITADYSEKQQFRTFYFVELSTGKKKEVKAPEYISFDSYIQGVVDHKLYIYDKDNEVQYAIDTDELKIKEVGNESKKIKYYSDGKWDKITVTKANKEIFFDYLIEDSDLDKFDYIYLVGGEKSGYYYMFDKVGSNYNVYRANVQNKKNITYLFKVADISDVYYVDEYIYYKKGNKLMYYTDKTGSRTILEYDELDFNENLVFGIYERK